MHLAYEINVKFYHMNSFLFVCPFFFFSQCSSLAYTGNSSHFNDLETLMIIEVSTSVLPACLTIITSISVNWELRLPKIKTRRKNWGGNLVS